jgi:hypothetical protein
MRYTIINPRGKVIEMTKAQFEIALDLINAYGDAEYHFGDFNCNTNREEANDLYNSLKDFLEGLIQEEE